MMFLRKRKQKKKYLEVSRTTLLGLKLWAKKKETTMREVMRWLILEAVEQGKELDVLGKDPLKFNRGKEFKYVISQDTKTYVSVEPEVHAAVLKYAEENKLKIIEATWRLVCIGTKLAFPEEIKNSAEILERQKRIDKIRADHDAMVEEFKKRLDSEIIEILNKSIIDKLSSDEEFKQRIDGEIIDIIRNELLRRMTLSDRKDYNMHSEV